MSVDAGVVMRLPMFARVPPGAVRAAAPMWHARRLSGGEGLWAEGTPADALGVVLSGELSARHAGVEVNRFGRGEIVGEVAAFFPDGGRSASVVAASPVELLTLSTGALATLRRSGSGVYDALLEQSLVTMVARVGRLNDRLARLVQGGEAAPRRKEASALARLWKALVPGLPPAPPPPVDALIRGLPGLEAVPEALLGELRDAFEAVGFAEGEPLFIEYEEADCAWLVASGEVAVLRNVGGERAERLTSAGPGDLLGVNSLVTRGRRTASCVATRPSWLYRLSFDACRALTGGARRWWWESMLATVATQMRLSTRQLATAMADASSKPTLPAVPGAARSRGDREFEGILAASGYLERLPGDTDELSKVSFVVDDDRRRNPRRPR